MGSTVPFNVAPVAVMLDALLVVTVGGVVLLAEVVKVISEPYVVPALLVATVLKW